MNKSQDHYANLARRIRDDIFEPSSQFVKRIFLCGANPNDPNSIRGSVAESIISSYYSYRYQIVYPEDVFDDLLYHRNSPDLLTLENLLVENVHAVVVIPESPGSFAELGAFTNDERLRQKVICVLDKKFQNDKSFINRGPVRLIRRVSQSRVLFIDPNDVSTVGVDLRNIISTIKDPFASQSKLNLFQIPNFLLPAIYILQPIEGSALIRLVEAATNDEVNAYALTVSGLSSLEKKKFIEISESKYRLSRVGREANFNLKGRGTEYKLLDRLRLAVFNMRYRGKSLSI